MFATILVTGGYGVAGYAMQKLAATLPQSRFLFPRSSELNLLKSDSVEAYMSRHKPDAVIHLAALSGSIALSMKYPATMLRDNTLMQFNILEAARLHKVRKTVMTLSTGAYPPSAPLPLKEDYLHDGAPHGSNYGYSFAKRLVEPAIRAYREEYRLPVVGLIPNGIFGEHDNFNYDDAPMLPALIRRFYENRTTTEPIVIWGDGTPLREYTYSMDVARAFMWALENYDDAQVLNSGTAEELTVKEIAMLIAEATGVDPSRIVFDTTKPKGVDRKSVDNSRFMSLSKFAFTPFREGLSQTVKWFDEAYRSDRGSLRLQAKSKG